MIKKWSGAKSSFMIGRNGLHEAEDKGKEEKEKKNRQTKK